MSLPDAQNTPLPLISIAMTTYNGSRFLEAQLASLFSQSYPHVEIVVCDDGSTDGKTHAILKGYADQQRLTFVVNGENLGYSRNFEKAASLCKGDFIAFADQDDIWHPDKLQTLLDMLGDKLLAYSDTALIDESNQEFSRSRFQMLAGKEKTPTSQMKAFRHKNILGCTMLLRKELFDLSRPFPPKDCEGHDNWLISIADKLDSVVYVNQPLVSYRIHGNNLSEGTVPKTFIQRLKHWGKSGNGTYKLVRSWYWAYKNLKVEKFKKTHPFWQNLRHA